jgi:RHS repeat-associated protein
MNGQMMAYDSGGVTKDFLTDHLGSITAEIDQNQNRTYETRYSAYGRNNWSTGTGCGFGWVGSYGYRETGLFHMSHYVRARHYSYVTGNWSTVDPLWPEESAYGYVKGRSSNLTDRFGTGGKGLKMPPTPKFEGGGTANDCDNPKPWKGRPCREILPNLDKVVLDALTECLKQGGEPKDIAKCIAEKIKGSGKSLPVQVLQYLACLQIGNEMGDPGRNACGNPQSEVTDIREHCCNGWFMVCLAICQVNTIIDPTGADPKCNRTCIDGLSKCFNEAEIGS